MADTRLFSRLRRLFSTDVIIRNQGGNQLKVVDVNKIQQGDANLIVGPTGKVALIDAGMPTMGDVVIIPYLLTRGIRAIDFLILTHPDPDHLGGMPEIIRSPLVDVKRLYLPIIPWRQAKEKYPKY